MTRIAFLGNCQVDVFAQLMRASDAPGVQVTAVEIWRHKPPEFDGIRERLMGHDLVVTQELSSSYGSLETRVLRSIEPTVLVIQNIFFQGYHPDCVYVGPMGARVKSPVGDYHSQCVHEQWRAGRTAKEAVQALEGYDDVRARAIFDKSASELLSREATVDVSVSDELLNPELGHRRMFTFNHPTIELHRIYLQRILDALGLKLKVGVCPDPLLQHTRWPIYAAVRRALGLPADRGTPLFRASASIGGQAFTAAEFCERSFAVYDRSSLPRG